MRSLPQSEQRRLRGIILRELSERRARNSRISLRSFARHLQVSPAHLSNLLSGRRPITSRQLTLICDRLNLSEEERGSIELASIKARSTKKEFLGEDELFHIRDWHALAILTLAQISSTKANSQWIARRLGITDLEALESIRRLEANAFLKQKHGRFRRTDKSFDTVPDLPSMTVRRILKQSLLRAVDALESLPVDEREYSTLYVALPKSKLKEAKALLRRFRKEFDEWAAEYQDSASDVFCFSSQLYPETRGEI